jgi:hypothetical protein
MKPSFDSNLAQMTDNERQKLDKEKLARIRARMDDLSRTWSALKAGQSITLDWTERHE